MPKMPLDFVIDDLACVRDGRKAALKRRDLAANAVDWLVILMTQAGYPEADTFRAVYSAKK